VTAGAPDVAFLPLRDVRLTGGPFAEAQRRALQTALALDPDRLLAPYRREAGLARGPGYGGWEADGLDGHTLGHVLSALSAHAAGGSDAARDRLEVILDGLRACQVATKTGYVGGVPAGEALWAEIAAGRVEAQTFDLNGRWVPLYNLHKTLTGVIDAVDYAGSATARVVADGLAAWWLETIGALTDERIEAVLRTESGGLPASFARWAALSGDRAFLDLAVRLGARQLWEPLAAGRDELDGLHANAQIPLVVGYAAIGRLGGDAPHLAEAARTFWASVVGNRSTAIGGDSVREHFPPRDDLSSLFTAREGPETCNTVNMVELAREMYLTTGEAPVLAFAERALSNHLLSAQHPEHGGIVYFTSHRPGHHRVYSRPEEGFWCCMGTGMEAPARFGALVYGQGRDRLDVNLLMGSRAQWDGVTVETATAYPFEDAATITVRSPEPRRFTLRIRVPEGVESEALATVDGEEHRAAPGEWLEIEREWRGEASVRLDLPPALRWEFAPDGSEWGWIVDGPRVLAARVPDSAVDPLATTARMGHIARGDLRPLAATPVLELRDLVGAERRPDGTVLLRDMTLEPFARLHDDRYILSWPVPLRTDAASRRAELAAADARADAEDAQTIDAIAFGQQQPESDHGLVPADSESGYDGGVHWRRFHGDAEVVLQDWGADAAVLRLTWLPDDTDRTLVVRLEGTIIEELRVAAGSSLDTTVEIDLGAQADGRSHWRFGLSGCPSGSPRVIGARLLRRRLA
jgi:DUF1680 family protein